MAPQISDAVVVDVLRRVHLLTTPLVRRLGRPPELVQAVVVGGVAAEHGVEDEAERVSLLARVLLDRDLPAQRVRPLLARAPGAYADDVLGEREDRSAVSTLWRGAPPPGPPP